MFRMMDSSKNIFPDFKGMVSRSRKEKLLNQKAAVFWFTGYSGSGKTTLAHELQNRLHAKGYLTCHLDGDNVRSGLNGDLGFTITNRKENIRRIAECAKLFTNNGLITLCSFVSPTQEIRDLAFSIIGNDFYEIYIKASLDTCESRDTKGLYKKARAGEIKDFTGIDSPYEIPEDPFLVVDTEAKDIHSCTTELLEALLPIIQAN